MLMLAIALVGALCSAAIAFWRVPELPTYWPLLLIALVPQVGNLFGIHIPGMFFVAIAAVLIWCICNWQLRGASIVALGVGLNLLVMAFYGGSMPIRADVLASLGQVAAPGTVLIGSKDVVVEASALWVLSDWIILPLGRSMIVVSPGDLILVAGVVWWLLASHQAQKEDLYVNVGRHPDVAGATYSAATRPK